MEETIKTLLEKKLEDVTVILKDPRNDGVHLEAVIISPSFTGLSLLNRHRKVKDSLKELFTKELHALSIKTYTTLEWREKHEK